MSKSRARPQADFRTHSILPIPPCDPQRKNNSPITKVDHYVAHGNAAEWGHTLGPFQKNGTVSIAACTKCGDRAILHEAMYPNGRSTGNALHFPCKETHGAE